MSLTYTISIAGSDRQFSCQPSQTLLQAAERAGAPSIPIGCRGGGCGVCKVQIIQGNYQSSKMSRAHISADDEAAGIVLACCIRPESDIQLRLLD